MRTPQSEPSSACSISSPRATTTPSSATSGRTCSARAGTPNGQITPERLAGTVARAHTLLSANKDTYSRTITGSRVEGQQDYVHGRSGLPCRRCGTTIEVAPLDEAGRVVFFCRTCQEGPFPVTGRERIRRCP
jgi:hypothetical protein